MVGAQRHARGQTVVVDLDDGEPDQAREVALAQRVELLRRVLLLTHDRRR
jgi:hypothetical protein